ncbi:MAG: hypothetical protein IJ341_02165 [Bacteroidales bacterium]|nr:hypothetical protein [Bacteroidales bacterium]
MAKEYIELDEALNVVSDVMSDVKVIHKHRALNRNLKQLSTEHISERKTGRWIKVYQNSKAIVYECSNCNHLTFGTSDYCICGAKMTEEN